MIRRIQVSNFRSLARDVSIELGPLTALVGVNASGKSNVADVLQFIADCVHEGLEPAVARRHGFGTIARSDGGRSHAIAIRIEVESTAGRGSWELSLGAAGSELGYEILHERGEWNENLSPDRLRDLPNTAVAGVVRRSHRAFEIVDGVMRRLDPDPGSAPVVGKSGLFLSLRDARFLPLVEQLEKIAVYKIFPDRLRDAQRPDFTHPMREHGENWASVLRRLPRDTAGPELLAALGRLTGDIDDCRVSAIGGYLIPEFRHITPDGDSAWRGAVQESDGTLRVAGILTALLQEPPLTLIGIEEPEQTIHPGALDVLVDYLREASQRGQVLLTTHSSDLLDLLDIDEIRVVERDGRTTTVSAVDEAQRAAVKRHLAKPGELVFSDGRLYGQARQGAHG